MFYFYTHLPFIKIFCSSKISGMALISMCIQLMQEQIMEKVTWLMAEIGMGGNSNNIEMMKVTKPERIKQTPDDMTGNELDFNEKRRKKDQKIIEEQVDDEDV